MTLSHDVRLNMICATIISTLVAAYYISQRQQRNMFTTDSLAYKRDTPRNVLVALYSTALYNLCSYEARRWWDASEKYYKSVLWVVELVATCIYMYYEIQIFKDYDNFRQSARKQHRTRPLSWCEASLPGMLRCHLSQCLTHVGVSTTTQPTMPPVVSLSSRCSLLSLWHVMFQSQMIFQSNRPFRIN